MNSKILGFVGLFLLSLIAPSMCADNKTFACYVCNSLEEADCSKQKNLEKYAKDCNTAVEEVRKQQANMSSNSAISYTSPAIYDQIWVDDSALTRAPPPNVCRTFIINFKKEAGNRKNRVVRACGWKHKDEKEECKTKSIGGTTGATKDADDAGTRKICTCSNAKCNDLSAQDRSTIGIASIFIFTISTLYSFFSY